MSTRYFYEPRMGHGLAHNPIASIVGPRPIAWISTVNRNGQLNLAPYSFFGIFNYAPPIIAFASDGIKDTLTNAIEMGEFVVNTVTDDLAEAMNLSSASIDGSEFEFTNLESSPSSLISTPRVARSLVSLECQVVSHFTLKDREGLPLASHMLIAEVVGVSIDKRLIQGSNFDWGDLSRIVRSGGPADYYSVGSGNLKKMRRPA